MASHPARALDLPSICGRPESGTLPKVVALFLGLLVAVLGFFVLMMWIDARDARDVAHGVVVGIHADHNTALPLNSFAGVVPENAAELAEAHTSYDADAAARAGGRPGRGADDAEGHDGRDRPWRSIQHLGVRRSRRPRSDHPRPRGPDQSR